MTRSNIAPELVADMTGWRRDFHRHPELGFDEHRTSARVAELLREFGLEVHTGVGGTGVVGVLQRGNGEASVAFRADMDALPITETGNPEWRSAHDGVEVGMVASHGGTSKDALVAHTAGLNASTAPLSGGQTYLLSTPFSEFADSERADVGLELMSTLGLTAFSMRPTPPKGGWHVTVVEDEHHSRRSLLLSMAEHALTHHARLQPVGLDRTDVRARIMGWSRDLGMGSDFTKLEAKNGEGMLPQQADLWTLAGDVVSLERLRHALDEPVVDEAITVQLQQLVSRSLSTMSGSMSAAFRADRVSHARRCFKATLVRLHLPEGHGFTKEQLAALRVVLTNAASAAFLDETSNVAAPKVLVTVTTLPSVLLNEPQLTVVNLTHAVDLIRAVLEDTQLELAEMTPHGLRSVRESKFKASQLSRTRIDAMIAALDGQAQTRVIEGWKVYWRLMRSRIFTGGYGGGGPMPGGGGGPNANILDQLAAMRPAGSYAPK